jgi:hypothetical protein
VNIDWRMVFMGLPTRRFTGAELRRAIPDPPSRSLVLAVAINVALPVAALAIAFGAAMPALVAAAVVIAGLMTGALWLAWRDPGARSVRVAYYLLPLLAGVAFGVLGREGGVATDKAVVSAAIVIVLGTLGLWFAIVYRHQYVVMRLRELDEQARAVEMARQLAAAQIQPHFLFNSLASLQQWVKTGDTRAAPLLEALSGYLRATLPLFEHRTLRLGDEAVAAAQYLEVMRLRLGERLRYAIAIEPPAGEAPVPPGVLLTLVENAVEHGVLPSLQGAEVRIAARLQDGRLVIDVCDTGPGLAPGAVDGTGLANTRARLRQARGEAATLTLSDAPGGGCRARVILPLLQESPP